MSHLLGLFASLSMFVVILFAINFIFLKIYKLEINFFDGFRFSVPTILFIYSGIIFDIGKNYLSNGKLDTMGDSDTIGLIILMMLGGFFLASVYNSRLLNKFYNIELSYSDCFVKNFWVILLAKIALVVIAIIIGLLLAILDSL